MLDPLDTWTKKFKSLPPADAAPVGMMNFANMLGDLMDKVQAGPTGNPGILTFARPIMAAQMLALTPSAGPEWATKLAAAWQTAMLASVITPGTVTLPAWTASVVDVNTLPTAAATIVTLSAAYAGLLADLMKIAATFQKPEPPQADVEKAPADMAKAFRTATLAFTFLCIGLAVPAVPVPVPLPAQ